MSITGLEDITYQFEGIKYDVIQTNTTDVGTPHGAHVSNLSFIAAHCCLFRSEKLSRFHYIRHFRGYKLSRMHTDRETH